MSTASSQEEVGEDTLHLSVFTNVVVMGTWAAFGHGNFSCRQPLHIGDSVV